MLLRLSPELAHDWGLAGLQWLRHLGPLVEVPAGLSQSCLGLEFAHPLGLAAGFDKNGDYLDALGALGFSHIEVGTVTPRPQAGNAKPRMFRVPHAMALVNRMGFNNKGVDHLVAQLARSAYRGVRGISIGKNADTPIENAAADYVACLLKVYPYADYVAVNVSSPNTARLRELQDPDGLQRIVGSLLEARIDLERCHAKVVPLLVKIAPDLEPTQVSALAANLRSSAWTASSPRIPRATWRRCRLPCRPDSAAASVEHRCIRAHWRSFLSCGRKWGQAFPSSGSGVS